MRTLFLIFIQLFIVISGQAQTAYLGHGADSIPPEVLKKYAPPALDSQVSAKINSMLDLMSPGAGLLHPNGKDLFFSWRISGQNQIWKISGPLSFPQQMTGGRDNTTLKEITPNGKYLIIERDIDGQENPGIYLQSVLGGALDKAFHVPKVKATFQFVSPDSKWVYFSANDQTPDSFAIYRYQIESKTRELVFDQPGLWSIRDEKDGKFILSKQTGSITNEVFLFDPSTKNLTPLIGQKQPDDYDVAFGSKPNTYIVLTPALGNFKRLYELKTESLQRISPEINYDISEFSIDHKREKIVYTVNEGGYSRIHALASPSYKKIDLPTFPGADHVWFGATTRDGRHTMLIVVKSQEPRTSYSYDWKTKKLTRWTLPSAPELNLNDFVPAKLETYTTRDNVQIPYFVRRPKKCENTVCPVIVLFHGGPEGQSLPGFNILSQLYLDEGFIFVEPNVRGSDGYGKEWLNSDNASLRLKVITDIEDCALHIRKNWSKNGVSPKIGVMGWSYGGYSTLMAMSRFAGAYDAGVALVGMSNLLTFLNNTAPYRRKLRITEYGDPEKDKEALISLSPSTYVDQIRAPLLIIQGAQDPRVPAGEAIQIHELMQSKNLKSQLIIFPDEGHGAQKKENRVLEWGHALRFFMTHLKSN